MNANISVNLFKLSTSPRAITISAPNKISASTGATSRIDEVRSLFVKDALTRLLS